LREVRKVHYRNKIRRVQEGEAPLLKILPSPLFNFSRGEEYRLRG
jgi:hypothetical protein